jgi:type III secretion protein R
MRARLWLFSLTVFLVPLLVSAQGRRRGPSAAETLSGSGLGGESFANKPLVLMVALGALGLAPFVLLMVTSFVKISVVLSIVRSALGTQQVPPTSWPRWARTCSAPPTPAT